MKKENSKFYLVDLSILPEAIKKTIQAKEMLKQGNAETINDAVKKTGLSRSAYYKYKDHVAPVFDSSDENSVTIFIVMQNELAVLSRILKKITKEKSNIITFSRSMPSGKLIGVTISFEIAELQITLSELIRFIVDIKGVKKVEIVGKE